MLRRGLRAGVEVDAAELRAEAEGVRAEDLAVAALSRRAHSVREMDTLLMRKGISRARTVATVAALTAHRLLDDSRFASEFVRSRLSTRGASIWSLRRDLARKGVERGIADEAISAVMADAEIDEMDVVRKEAAKKWRALGRLDPDVARRRLIAFLRRRGFGGDAIRAVVKELREQGDA